MIENGFQYAQPRLHARHGSRLDDGTWQQLLAIDSYALFLKHARQTALAPWLQNIGSQSDIYTIERVLREQFRHYTMEVASWLPVAWRPATQWIGHLPDLPFVTYLAENPTVDGHLLLPWMREDRLLSILTQAEMPEGERGAKMGQTGLLLTLLFSVRAGKKVGSAWLSHWRSLWPESGPWSKPLEGLIAQVERHVSVFGTLEKTSTAQAARVELRRQLQLGFRRHTFQPAGVFIHLGLVALELEMLRGGLAKRRLFNFGDERETTP
ncbi:MAG: V-type ATPase subunit [Magnetococcus sp. DMHC-6]